MIKIKMNCSNISSRIILLVSYLFPHLILKHINMPVIYFLTIVHLNLNININ